MNDEIRIGASDIMRLMKGDWYVLYREKMGLQDKKPFANTIHSQLGLLTEDYHSELLSAALSADLTKPEELATHPYFGWAVAQVDRLWGSIPVELKFPHHSTWFENRLEAYWYQLQWQMFVMEADHAIFSCLWIDKHEWKEIKRCADTISILWETAKEFRWHCHTCIAPKRVMQL